MGTKLGLSLTKRRAKTLERMNGLSHWNFYWATSATTGYLGSEWSTFGEMRLRKNESKGSDPLLEGGGGVIGGGGRLVANKSGCAQERSFVNVTTTKGIQMGGGPCGKNTEEPSGLDEKTITLVGRTQKLERKDVQGHWARH